MAADDRFIFKEGEPKEIRVSDVILGAARGSEDDYGD